MELAALKNIHNKDFVYYDVKTGNAIKKWIDGYNPNDDEVNSKQFLDCFTKRLQKLHSTKNKYGVINHDHYEFIKFVKNKLSQAHIVKYKNLIEKYKNLKLVLSHNDLSHDNLLVNKQDNVIYFIDYEWARMNNKYWDVANFIRETNLKKKWIKYLASANKLDLTILNDFIYICINYAYQWTFAMPQTSKILSYRKKILNKLKEFN
jgi:thiamine kinase-like enzyme